MFCSFTFTLLAALPGAAQAGGEATIQFEFHGQMDERVGQYGKNVGDLDGDGFDDILVSNWDSSETDGDLWVLSGATGTILYTRDGFENRPTGMSGGHDINGDGYTDFVVGTNRLWANNDGMVRIYSGKNGAVLRTIEGPDLNNSFGTSPLLVSDLNADGKPDIILRERNADLPPNNNVGAIHFYSAIDGVRIRSIYGTPTENPGYPLADVGDYNGDGISDFLAGNEDFDSERGVVYMYSGSDGMRLFRYLGEEQGDGFGKDAVAIDDLDGDGVREVVVSAWLKNRPNNPGNHEGAVYVLSGADGTVLRLHWGSRSGQSFGHRLTGSGDVDGDGFQDYLVASKSDDITPSGWVTLFSGKTGIPLDEFSITFAASYELQLGEAMAMLDDLDGDGRREVLITDPTGEPSSLGGGSVYRYAFDPQISSSTYSVSAASGGSVDFQMDFPTLAAGLGYKLLISSLGYGPVNIGIKIPLTPDSFANDSYIGNYPFPVHSGMHGVLDGSGDALASITLPSLPTGYVGRSLYFAAIVEPAGQPPLYASSPVPLTILP